jgi:hypothetical protein
MPIYLNWSDIAGRLLSAFVSGGLIGLDRSEDARWGFEHRFWFV